MTFVQDISRLLARQRASFQAAQSHLVQAGKLCGSNDSREVVARSLDIELDAIERHLGEAQQAIAECRRVSKEIVESTPRLPAPDPPWPQLPGTFPLIDDTATPTTEDPS